jgi:uncharacterized membrane protein YhaH (DUF805 family)
MTATTATTEWTPTTTTTTAAPRIDQARYWVGAAMTAVVTALLGVIGLIIAHDIVHAPVQLGSGAAATPVPAATYGLVAAAIVFAAAAVYNALLHICPRPTVYYSWLISVLTLLAVLLPFTTTAALTSHIVFAATNLMVGLSVLLLVPMAAVNARSER